MAKKLSVGELVKVREEFWLKHNTDGYKNGLRRLRPQDVGQIADIGEGRSVVVDFDGKRATLSSQRLERYTPPAEPAPESAPEAAPKAPPAATEPIDYYHPPFIKMVANNLLRNGSLEAGPDTVVVAIKLADLPQPVQEQVRALIEAKLDLGPEGAPRPRRTRRAKPASAKPTGRPRGRPRKQKPAE
ncbi:MAG: hypothetical protein IT324_07755 [Anaerolineae bacterium]|nr:hypothetical protein [Anaerolineae bacterium]